MKLQSINVLGVEGGGVSLAGLTQYLNAHSCQSICAHSCKSIYAHSCQFEHRSLGFNGRIYSSYSKSNYRQCLLSSNPCHSSLRISYCSTGEDLSCSKCFFKIFIFFFLDSRIFSFLNIYSLFFFGSLLTRLGTYLIRNWLLLLEKVIVELMV